MKIVCLSDTHMLHNHIEVPDGDVLIHAGDMTNFGTIAEIYQVAEWMRTLPHKHKLIICGNHEREIYKSLGEKEAVKTMEALFSGVAEFIHERTFEIDGIKFYGQSKTPEFFDWGWMYKGGQEALDIWARMPYDIDVLVAHGPPFTFADLCVDYQTKKYKRVGCPEQLEVLKKIKPKLLICGHIHYSQGIYLTDFGTTIVNASICTEEYKPENKPIVINI